MFKRIFITRVCSTIILTSVLGAYPAEAGSLDMKDEKDGERLESIHEAEQTVDRAWETYHRAALGGTLASPSLQTEIELHLHEARTLLPKAQEAAEQRHDEEMNDVLRQIGLHTQLATLGSMEHKR